MDPPLLLMSPCPDDFFFWGGGGGRTVFFPPKKLKTLLTSNLIWHLKTSENCSFLRREPFKLVLPSLNKGDLFIPVTGQRHGDYSKKYGLKRSSFFYIFHPP